MKALPVLALLALAGCGDADTKFAVTTDNELVNRTLSQVRAACPGLDVYNSQFVNVRVEEHHRAGVAFDIPESAKLPPLFAAGGHTCFVEIEADGKSVVVEKSACKSVCLNRSQVPEGQLVLPLSNSAG